MNYTSYRLLVFSFFLNCVVLAAQPACADEDSLKRKPFPLPPPPGTFNIEYQCTRMHADANENYLSSIFFGDRTCTTSIAIRQPGEKQYYRAISCVIPRGQNYCSAQREITVAAPNADVIPNLEVFSTAALNTQELNKGCVYTEGKPLSTIEALESKRDDASWGSYYILTMHDLICATPVIPDPIPLK